MSKELKKYKARIFGEVYPILSSEDEMFILQVVRKVDMLMNDIATKYDTADVKRVAVLAALKSAEEALVLQNAIQQEKDQSNKIMALLQDEVS